MFERAVELLGVAALGCLSVLAMGRLATQASSRMNAVERAYIFADKHPAAAALLGMIWEHVDP